MSNDSTGTVILSIKDKDRDINYPVEICRIKPGDNLTDVLITVVKDLFERATEAESQVKLLQTKLSDILYYWKRDPHKFKSGYCNTCKLVSDLLEELFGCYDLQ